MNAFSPFYKLYDPSRSQHHQRSTSRPREARKCTANRHFCECKDKEAAEMKPRCDSVQAHARFLAARYRDMIGAEREPLGTFLFLDRGNFVKSFSTLRSNYIAVLLSDLQYCLLLEFGGRRLLLCRLSLLPYSVLHTAHRSSGSSIGH